MSGPVLNVPIIGSSSLHLQKWPIAEKSFTRRLIRRSSGLIWKEIFRPRSKANLNSLETWNLRTSSISSPEVAARVRQLLAKRTVRHSILIQNTLIYGHKCSTVLRTRERVSERAVRNKRKIERCERTSEWPCILGDSESPYKGIWVGVRDCC